MLVVLSCRPLVALTLTSPVRSLPFTVSFALTGTPVPAVPMSSVLPSTGSVKLPSATASPFHDWSFLSPQM